jgi:hypothetical protein
VWRKDLDDATKKKIADFIFGFDNSGNAEADDDLIGAAQDAGLRQ